jgi:hypothetical protein
VTQRCGYERRIYTGASTSRGDQVEELVFEHYLPRQPGGLHPAVFITEFLGGRVPEFIPRIFLEEGWQVLVMRWPQDMLHGRKGGAEVEETLLELIIDARRCLDWLCRQPGVDPDRLGSFGVSFGGIVNLVLSAVDLDPGGVPRLKYSAVALVGEDLASLLLTSEERGVLKYIRERHRFSGVTPGELALDLARCVRSDPMFLAPYLDPSRLLVFLARLDRTVPYENGRRLHRRLGEPELYVLPFGHYSFVLGQVPVPWLGNRLKERFHARLAAPSTAAAFRVDH